jgi:signal transduction histidine kinase
MGVDAAEISIVKMFATRAGAELERKQAAQSLADYHRTLEREAAEKTHELRIKSDELEETLQKLKMLQNQLILSEKMASLGALTAGIAHEIKNPLNLISNFAELSAQLTEELLEELQDQKDRLDAETVEFLDEILSDLRQNVTKINTHGRRADSIVQGMLLHSRGKSGERHPTDVNALLAEDITLAYHGMRAKDTTFNIDIEMYFDETIGRIDAVPQDISRVFLNIINNGCYAAHQKEKALGDEEFAPTLSVWTKNRGDRVEIRIRDNGTGIPKDVVDKVFNPFFTTKPTGEGTGLGLSLSHDIVVEAHKGEIQIETEAGSYTEFIISLPKDV